MAYLFLRNFSDINENLSKTLYIKLYLSNILDKTDIGNRYGIILVTHIFNPLKAPSDTVAGLKINKLINNRIKIGIKFLLNIKQPPITHFIVNEGLLCLNNLRFFVFFITRQQARGRFVCHA